MMLAVHTLVSPSLNNIFNLLTNLEKRLGTNSIILVL